ncbi:MAG: hypothetical protein ABI305_08535 [Tepidiformaceae bacterium]
MLSAVFRFRVIRRSITIPGFLLGWLVACCIAPVLLPLVLIGDLLRRNRLAWTRAYLMFLVYLSCEMVGIVASGWLWATARRDQTEFLNRNFRLQCWWANTQFRAALRIYSLTVDVRGSDAVASGPLILLVRHVSVFDNLLPAVFVSERHGIRLRWVINRSLLRDPCLDIVGNRLPNCFVSGGRTDSEAEIAKVRDLGHGLSAVDGIAIYPEGGLFSPAKRARAIKSLREREGAEAATRAEAFKNVLPPRPGGTLALIDAAPGVDVVVCAHSGLERAASVPAILAGSLIGATLTIEFQRFAAASIPTSPGQREQWLFDRWSEVEAWVSHSQPRKV